MKVHRKAPPVNCALAIGVNAKTHGRAWQNIAEFNLDNIGHTHPQHSGGFRPSSRRRTFGKPPMLVSGRWLASLTIAVTVLTCGLAARWISTWTSRARNYSRRIALPAIIVQGASPRTGLAGRCRTFCSSTTRPAPPWRRHSLHIFSRSTPLAQSRGPPSTNGGRPRLTLRSRRHAPLCRYRSDRFWLPREVEQQTEVSHQAMSA